jgi:hypothetical protein
MIARTIVSQETPSRWERDFPTVLIRSRLEIMVREWNEVGKYFRINSASHVGA